MKIAIDGPAASGKTSLGRSLAAHFGYTFIETGKMYRAVAYGLGTGLRLDQMSISFRPDGRLLLNGTDITDKLHTPDIDEGSSQVATRADVRQLLVSLQRKLAAEQDVVMEGRDIGTVVLPDADVKIFLAASPEERARRRARERGSSAYSETLRDLASRDHRDSTRALSPLNAAQDAVTIESSNKSLVEVISEAIALVKERLGNVDRPAQISG
ncbi:(d)CMP kinase [Candidatus Bipolaricaulota bacterium]|nr:(d)CMP kinase [Candidatus Bipolaricaulota bacterium]